MSFNPKPRLHGQASNLTRVQSEELTEMGEYTETLERERAMQRHITELEAQLAAAKRLLEMAEGTNATLTAACEAALTILERMKGSREDLAWPVLNEVRDQLRTALKGGE